MKQPEPCRAGNSVRRSQSGEAAGLSVAPVRGCCGTQAPDGWTHGDARVLLPRIPHVPPQEPKGRKAKYRGDHLCAAIRSSDRTRSNIPSLFFARSGFTRGHIQSRVTDCSKINQS